MHANMATAADGDVSKQLTQQIENLSIMNDVLTICANCGKVVVGNPNI